MPVSNPCLWDGVQSATAGKIDLYLTAADCAAEENSLATLDVAYFYALASTTLGVWMYPFFMHPDAVARPMLDCAFNTLTKLMFEATENWPRDEDSPYKMLCSNEWSQDNALASGMCYDLGVGGSVNVVSPN